jgi:2-oxoglutarate ferredoxin oxidoreductase subunit beta
MHDGSTIVLRKIGEDYDPTHRAAAMAYLNEHHSSGTIPTGLLFVDESGGDMHAMAKTVEAPLSQIPYGELCPGNAALQQLQRAYR